MPATSRHGLNIPPFFPKLVGTFVAQTLAARYNADPSAADWRRFGRLPGFTNCKPKYKRPDGLHPFVRLKSHTGEQYAKAESFVQEITKLYEAREQERASRRLQVSLSPQRNPRLSNLSLERFRTSSKYNDRPAAADIAFCVAAYANGMSEALIACALGDGLSLPRSQPFQARFLHPSNHDESSRLGKPLSHPVLYRPVFSSVGFFRATRQF